MDGARPLSSIKSLRTLEIALHHHKITAVYIVKTHPHLQMAGDRLLRVRNLLKTMVRHLAGGISNPLAVLRHLHPTHITILTILTMTAMITTHIITLDEILLYRKPQLLQQAQAQAGVMLMMSRKSSRTHALMTRVLL